MAKEATNMNTNIHQLAFEAAQKMKNLGTMCSADVATAIVIETCNKHNISGNEALSLSRLAATMWSWK